jgi:NADPH2:quinone reductase
VAVPQPARGEILVRVRCASLDPVDWKIAGGHFRLLVRGGLPRTMGSDFCGEITALGPGVDGWAVGRPVLGFVDPFQREHGTFADYVPVPVGFLGRRPLQIDERVGAALPCVGVTAVALCNLARVTAVASARRRDFATGLGCDSFIDYGATPPGRWPGDYDAVLDCVPSLPRATHARLLARGGHYASTLPGAASCTIDPVLNRLGRVRRHAVMLRPDDTALGELFAHLEQGGLRCEIAGEYPLEQAATAIERSRSGRVAGKLVIRIA